MCLLFGAVGSATLDSARAAASAVTGSGLASSDSYIPIVGLVSEEDLLRAKGFSPGVISTLVNSRKSVTRAIIFGSGRFSMHVFFDR